MHHPYTILIADDDKELTEILSDLLRYNGYNTYATFEGIRTIQAAHKEKPDLIILDLKMPAGSGRNVLQALRTRPETRDIPVIILTGIEDPFLRDEVTAAGAQDFVRKPYNSEDLLKKIKTFLPVE